MKLLFFLLFSFAIPCTCLWDAASDTFPQEYYDISDIIFTLFWYWSSV